MLLSTSQL